MKNHLLVLLTFLSLTSCTQKNSTVAKTALIRQEVSGLSEEIAKERKESISNISYLFEIDLKRVSKSSSFKGVSTVNFDFDAEKFVSEKVTVDFAQGSVQDVLVNDESVTFDYNQFFISISKNLFKKGKNRLKILFEHPFSQNGSGFYKFSDNTDGATYVYTDFEPYDANHFAPMFDQPNLKATYSLNVEVPKDWTVITSVKEQMVKDKKDHKLWSFPPSEKFSTYIFSLHGGPYTVWSDKIKLKSKEIPLKLYARKSVSKFVKPDFWFKITKQGFNFFEQYFSTDYPYAKYDQVLVPDFNSGAMENVAAVTFNELYISREKIAPRAHLRRLANVIFHEMAHMWFGNLVTMDWWNDLWLNESFATFMANTGLYYNTEFTEIWTAFNTRTKQWAYTEDKWRTTHPIEADIPSTNEATANFDGITYGKGASTLKQLVFLIGEENFKKGLADYFKAYAQKNTLRKNFIDSLQVHTKEDLVLWTKEWLQTKGLNSLDSVVQCSKEKLVSIDFYQGVVSGQDTLRTHKIKLALWLSSNPSSPEVTQDIRISGAKTSWNPKKEMPCPQAVYPNWEDHAFAQVNLDTKSLEYFEKNIDRVDSKLMRSQFWSTVKRMLSLGNLEPEKIFSLIKTHLPKEEDADALNSLLLTSVLDKPSASRPNKTVFDYYSNTNRALKEQTELSKIIQAEIAKKQDPNAKKFLFNTWLMHTYKNKPSALETCLQSGCSFDLGFALDPDRKWLILQFLAASQNKKAKALMTKLSKNDSSRRAELYKSSIEASLAKNKSKLLNPALDPNQKMSLKKRNAIITGLIPQVQMKANQAFIHKTFFEKIDKISGLPVRVQKTFAKSFQPLFCGDFAHDTFLSEKMITESKWSFSVKKVLLQALDSDERCMKIKHMSVEEEV